MAIGLTRIELEVLASNEPAIAFYKKHDFELEGLKRESRYIDGKYDDVAFMALLIDSPMRTMHIQTKNLKLVPHTPEDVRIHIERLNAEQIANLPPDWLAHVRVAKGADPWMLGFALVHRFTDVVIGMCGFNALPEADGIVEISYGIEPEHQGNGYATEAAEALVAYAFSGDQVRMIRAHTFSETNASARVLSKCGFRLVGEVWDPKDGMVWRWERYKEKA